MNPSHSNYPEKNQRRSRALLFARQLHFGVAISPPISINKMRSAILAPIPVLIMIALTWASTNEAYLGQQYNQITGETEILTLDKKIEREIGNRQSHLFQIHLSKGQFLCVVLSTQNAAFAFTFFDPQKRKKQEFANRWSGQTTLSYISDISGIYTLEVRSVEEGENRATYELKIEQLRGAVAQDAIVIAAEKTVAEAEKLRKEWKVQSLLQAINKYEEARKAFGNLDNRREEAYVLNQIGEVYASLGQNPKAVEYYNQALRLSEATTDRRLEIEILNNLSGINIDSSKKQIVLEYCDKAQALSKQIGYVRGEAQAINNLGELHSYVLGEKEEAINIFDRAMPLWQAAGDRRGQAQTLSNLGYTHTDLGNVKKALFYFSDGLLLWQAVKDRRGEALTLTAMGLAQSTLGEMQKAIENHNKAMHLFQMIGDQIGEAITLNGMAYVYDNLGEKRQALKLYDKALSLYQTAGRRSGEAVTLGLIGEIYESLGEKQEALEYYHKKLAIVHSTGNPRAEAYTLAGIGTVYDSLADHEKALDYYTKALALSRSLRDPRCQAYCLNSVGYAHDRLGRKEQAIALYKEALDLLRAAEDRAGETLTLHRIAHASLELEDMAGAYDNCKRLLDIIENQRVKVTNQNLRASYFASVHSHYELYIDLLMKLHKREPKAGYAAAALEASEKARGRSLLDLLNEAGADIRQGVDPVLLEKERDLQQLLNSKAERQVRLLSDDHTQERAAAIRKEITELTSEYEAVLAEIRSRSPGYGALIQPQTLSLQQIQREILDENTILLEYSLGDEQSYLWVVTPDSITTVELPDRAEIEDAAVQLYRLLVSFTQIPEGQSARQRRAFQDNVKAKFSETAAALSRMLLGSVAPQLGTKRLVIVADGALQYVPFVALPEPSESAQDKEVGQPLMVNHEIISLPSVSVLAALRRELSGRSPAPKTLAVLADPVFEKDDSRFALKAPAAKGRPRGANANSGGKPGQGLSRSLGILEDGDDILSFQRLPSSRMEATAITNLVPPRERKLALDFEASLSTATSAELRHYRIIHFATHALIYGAHPQLYGIVLSLFDEKGNPQDGFLRLNEIYNLKLPTEMVVLSACQTAIGKEIKGEGLVGLTRGFMYAGAARVVASLWKIDDRASAEFMRLFYESMLGPKHLPPAKALQAAQIAMWKSRRWSFPYYWAAFTLQGEWR